MQGEYVLVARFWARIGQRRRLERHKKLLLSFHQGRQRGRVRHGTSSTRIFQTPYQPKPHYGY